MFLAFYSFFLIPIQFPVNCWVYHTAIPDPLISTKGKYQFRFQGGPR